MSDPADAKLTELAASLRQALGENLLSCCVYGSVARGNAIAGVSDLNLLLVLRESTGSAHEAIATVIGGRPEIEPFVLERDSLVRTARCFASKFASIQRNCRVILGADPFAGLTLDPGLERLLCEQAVRNLRLRLTYAFITRQRRRDYGRFLANSVSPIFIHLAEVLRLNSVAVPKDFTARIPVMQATWPGGETILRDLASLRQSPRTLSAAETPRWHADIVTLLDAVLDTIAREWKAPATVPPA